MKITRASTRRITLLALMALIVIGSGAFYWTVTPGLREPVAVPAPDYWPTNGWQTSSPEAQGYSSEKLAAMLQNIQKNGTAIDSLLIVHNGYVILDAHFAPYDGTFPHNLASVTKSVTTTLIGIAVDQGKINLDDTMVSFFPNRTIVNLDERKARITVRDLVSARNGMQSGCMADDAGTIAMMRAKPDWVQAALDRPMVAEPGTKFCYDSPGMHILSAILQEATGMTMMEFAQKNLFQPLGIRDAIWDIDPHGYSRGWGDLHLTPESMAKIGYLWLHQGNWNGQQIVSKNWVLDSVQRHSTKVDHDSGYGYGWWINMSHYFAAGRMGQNIRVIPALNTVLVTTGGGFAESEIEGFLLPMLFQSKRTLPVNLDGQAALQSTLTNIQHNADIPEGLPVPQIASAVSNKMYRCEKNPVGLDSLQIDFDNPNVATLYQKSTGQDVIWQIGMDGHYRQSAPSGDAILGYWEDANTFHLQIFDLGTQNYSVKFQGDNLQVTSKEANVIIPCQIQTPST